MNTIALLIHGGAGAIEAPEVYREGMNHVIEHGRKLLEEGGGALDVVEACVMLLEDDEHYNAGRGSVLNSKGGIEMDAAIMDGRDMRAGAVAAITSVRNPIWLARKVMEETEHVLLIGEGAMEFATSVDTKMEPNEYFITPRRQSQFEEAKKSSRVVLDHSSVEKKLGTVGAVAIDVNGNLAAATSTGGIVNKKYGRVGDTPIVGAGVYAENETCAVSTTGFGEQMIRTSLAKTIAEIIRYKSVGADEAAKHGIEFFVKKVKGLGGVIVIDRPYHCKVHSRPVP
jgi:beta-aspartyl-peptidase (threonine type)